MGIDIITILLNLILGAIDLLLPAIGVSDEFLGLLDNAFSMILDIVFTAAWFVDVNIFVTCFFVMIAIDQSALGMKMGRWIIGLIRGSG